MNSNNEKYSYYRNQASLSTDEELKRELGKLQAFDEQDIFYVLIEREVREKTNIILSEIEKRAK